jgi:phosphomethylpyrimidine synthase
MTSKVTRRGEIHGLTKLVNITEDVRKYAAEQKISEQQALQVGLDEKARQFRETGTDVYSKV